MICAKVSNRRTQRGAVTLIAVILLITVITFSALTAVMYTKTGIDDTLEQDNSIAALFLAESGLEAATYNYDASSTCSNAGVGAGTTSYGRGSFEIVSGVTAGANCRITVYGIIGSVRRTVQADVRYGAGGTATYAASTSVSTGNNTASVLVNRPGGTTGHLLIAQIVARGGTGQTITAPAGWTLVTNGRVNSGTTLAQAVYYRVIAAGEPATYTWSFSSAPGNRVTASILRFTGANTTTPINASNGQANASSVTTTAPSITTTVANTMLVGLFGTADGNADFTVVSGGMTQRQETSTGAAGNGDALLSATAAQAAIGATGIRTATADRAAVNIGHLVAIAPGTGATTVVTWTEP